MMRSLLRVYNSKQPQMINLTYVQRIDIVNNNLKFWFSNNKDTIGSFIFGFGWVNTYKQPDISYSFETPQDAKKEFDTIQSELNQYYSHNQK